MAEERSDRRPIGVRKCLQLKGPPGAGGELGEKFIRGGKCCQRMCEFRRERADLQQWMRRNREGESHTYTLAVDATCKPKLRYNVLVSAVGEASGPTRLGRYELITRIGQGGMAEVQLALQRGPAGFEKLVVVKLVHNSLASQKAFVDMLLDEARVAALVKHPNVVDIYDLGQADGRFFIAMEYLEGEPLLAVLRAGREGKRLDPLSTGRLIADTAEGLDAAHELRSMSGERLELVHHDISLGNIVVLYNGQVKLVDFGVAKATQAGTKSKVQGKFSYMAPEKLKGDAGDRRSDIFSLGCVMWESLTLKRLFRGGNDAETMKQVLETTIQPPSKVNADVPPEYDAIVMRALDRKPANRQSTAKELAVEIEEMLRKRGYGGKNDKIAKYMQETFKTHIEARKKLVQEVVSKGSASAEVLEQAFNDPVLASGSPVSPTGAPAEFSGKYRRITPPSGVPAVAAPWADSSKPTQISAPPVFEPGDDDDDDKATVLVPTARSPLSAPVAKAVARSAPPPAGRPGLPAPRTKSSTATPPPAPMPAAVAPSAPMRATTASEIDKVPVTEVDAKPMGDIDPIDGPMGPLSGLPTVDVEPVAATGLVASILSDKKKRLYVGIGAGVLLLLVIIVVASGGGDDKKPVASGGSNAIAHGVGSDDSSGRGSAIDAPDTDHAGSGDVDTGSANAGSDAAGSGSGSGDPDIQIDTGSGSSTSPGPGSNAKRGSGAGSGRTTPPDHSDHIVHNNNNDRPPPPPPPPRIDAEETVQKGLQAFVKGDAKGALALLLKAKGAKPGYAPTYRVLGRVYKKLGDNGNAKKAFQKYLALSPSASDADMIREEIKKL